MPNSVILLIFYTHFSGKNVVPPKVDWAPTPDHNVKLLMAFNSSESDPTVYILSMPTQKDVTNGHSVCHKQTGNEI